jgi:hypothetical protein
VNINDVDLENMDNPDRTVIAGWVRRHLVAWEARDSLTISGTLHPEVDFMLPTVYGVGHGQARATLGSWLAQWQTLRLYLRRLLIDVEQGAAAAEWVCRYTQPGQVGCQELLGGTVLDFDRAGLVRRWRTYLDPVRRRMLSDLNAPWPDEGWSPSSNPGPSPTPALIEQIIHAYAQAWSNHSEAQLSAVIHDEICLQPPWDYQVGRAALAAGAQVYFDNYTDTLVTPHRFILDPTQPNFGICEQTFACTNPDTGRRGEDHDFAFFEIAQGKLRYWRTYFDTTHSVQVVEKTIGALRRQ